MRECVRCLDVGVWRIGFGERGLMQVDGDGYIYIYFVYDVNKIDK